MTLQQAKNDIANILKKVSNSSITKTRSNSLTTATSIKNSKFYEAWVLAHVLEELHNNEGFTFRLSKGSKIYLKSGGGPINYHYPYFMVFDSAKNHIGNIFTDIEFFALSATHSHLGRSAIDRTNILPIDKSDVHELDILFCKINANSYPWPDEIYLGIECKAVEDVVSKKYYLKSILGVRRELSFLSRPLMNQYGNWPQTSLKANPAVCLMFYSKDPKVASEWASAQKTFDINFQYLPY
ncbi:hypothetical protein ACM66T_05810 [Sulfurimonas sp. ST-25]|uniref:hypothetical protein n=1 Tax=Sulfurimonas sp. ST-25 TaxID=3400151 RepID=UPI003A844F80